MTLIEAIAHIEGFYTVGSRPNRNNNPGDIQYGSFAKMNGADRIEEGVEHPRFAHFPTPEVGFAALHALLSGPTYSGLTIEDAIDRYAPPSENQTSSYVDYVCHQCGCQKTDLVKDVLGESS